MVFVMAGCSKEESLETGGTGGGSTSGALLTKIQSTGAQTATQDFTYDGNKRLVKYVSSGTFSGTSSNTTLTITRDASGRVTRIVEDIPASTGSPASSTPTTFYYQGPTDSKLKYAITLIEAPGFGFSFRDSIVFTYTGSSVSKTTHFYSIDEGASYEELLYSGFKYDARGNMIEQSLYQDMGSGYEPLQTVTAEYDNKPAPLDLNDDAFTEYGPGFLISPNNVTKFTLSSDLAGVLFTLVSTYEYRSDGKPSKASGSLNGSSVQAVYSYK